MCGQPEHNTRPHSRLQPSFLGMDNLTTECSFDSQAMWVIDLLGLIFLLFWCLYDQALADIRSTGAGIKCLYCRRVLLNGKGCGQIVLPRNV